MSPNPGVMPRRITKSAATLVPRMAPLDLYVSTREATQDERGGRVATALIFSEDGPTTVVHESFPTGTRSEMIRVIAERAAQYASNSGNRKVLAHTPIPFNHPALTDVGPTTQVPREVQAVAETFAQRTAEITWPLIVATDASVASHNTDPGAGLGYITDTGRYHATFNETATDRTIAELEALLVAVVHYINTPLTFVLDNKKAIRYVTNPTLCEKGAAYVLGERIRAALHPDSAVLWVKGHQGHQLNEIADRLAVAARRNFESGTDCAIAEMMYQSIATAAETADTGPRQD